MTKKIAAGVIVSGLLSASVAAHAAPPPISAGAEQPKERVGSSSAVALKTVEAVGVWTAVDCGAPYMTTVSLKNLTSAPWSGHLSFIVAGVTADQAVTLAKDEKKGIEVFHSKKLDCTKPLGTGVVEVHGNAGPVQATIKIAPSGASYGANYAQPAPIDPARPWLHRLVLTATCGQKVRPSVVLSYTAPTPKQVSIKLSYGATSTELTPTLPGNGDTQVFLDVPAPLDCQAPTGLSPIGYAFANAQPTTGELRATNVFFGPHL